MFKRLSATLIATLLLIAPAVAGPDEEKDAIMLISVMAFVEKNCPAYKPDILLGRMTIEEWGVKMEDIQKPQLQARGIAMITSWMRSVAENCREAWLRFGPDGSQVSNVITRR